MAKKFRDNPPTAERPGLYGCCHCGSYALLAEGDHLACRHCRSARPLVYVDAHPTDVAARTDGQAEYPPPAQ